MGGAEAEGAEEADDDGHERRQPVAAEDEHHRECHEHGLGGARVPHHPGDDVAAPAQVVCAVHDDGDGEDDGGDPQPPVALSLHPLDRIHLDHPTRFGI